MSNKQLTPRIRFKGFNDDWEQRKLRDLCILFTDGDWIESKDQSDSGVRLVQTGNVGIAKYINKKNNQKWISEETFKRLNCEEVLPGDILISRLPEPAGRACIMPFLGMKMITAVDCTIVRTAYDCSNKFLIQYLSSQNYFNEVNTALAGGTRQRISRSNLASFYIPIPANYKEQVAIGGYFENLDNLITLHQRKVDKLLKLKQALLEKMFPLDGEVVPQIRFKGFNNDWEQRKLSDVVISHNAGVYISKNNYGEGTNIIGVGDIYDSDVVCGEIYRLAPVKDDKFLLKKDDLIYGESSLVPKGIARTMYVDENGSGVAFAWHTRRVEVDQNKVNSHLLTLQINYVKKSRDHLMKVSTQTALTGMTTRGYFSTPITYPSLEEQVMISKFFTNLDNLITLHQRKVDKLKKTKQALLEKMFV